MAITKNSQIDLNGNEMILDADGDTTITADTDDQIDFKTAGTDRVQINSTGDFLVRQTDANVYDTNTGGSVRQYWGNQFSAQNNTNSKIIIGSGSAIGLIGGATTNSASKFIVNSYMVFGQATATAGSEAGYIDFYTSSGGAAGTQKMRLQSDGKLSVTEINHLTSGTLEIGNGDEKQLFDASGATIQFQTSDSERMRITTNNVFLNQTATADSGVADGRLEITRGSQHCLNCHVAGTGNSTLVAFINDNGFVGGINTNGSATVYNTSSDARLKNVLGEAKGLEVVNALNPVNFEWKNDGKIQDGLIAQEVEKVFPDAVSEPELEGEWYSVDYSKLVTPLIKAMQEQQEQIESLQQQIEELKNGN